MRYGGGAEGHPIVRFVTFFLILGAARYGHPVKGGVCRESSFMKYNRKTTECNTFYALVHICCGALRMPQSNDYVPRT